MASDLIEKLKAAEAARTPGVWQAGPPAWFRGRTSEEDGKRPITAGPDGVIGNVYGAGNATYIAACTECVPALLDRLTAAEAVCRAAAALDDAREQLVRDGKTPEVEQALYRAVTDETVVLPEWREKYGDE